MALFFCTKMIATLVMCITALFHLTSATFSDIEAGYITLQQDTLSFPQIGLLKTMFVILLIMWLNGILPIMVNVPLPEIAHKRSMDYLSLIKNTEIYKATTIMSRKQWHECQAGIMEENLKNDGITIFCTIKNHFWKFCQSWICPLLHQVVNASENGKFSARNIQLIKHLFIYKHICVPKQKKDS